MSTIMLLKREPPARIEYARIMGTNSTHAEEKSYYVECPY